MIKNQKDDMRLRRAKNCCDGKFLLARAHSKVKKIFRAKQ